MSLFLSLQPHTEKMQFLGVNKQENICQKDKMCKFFLRGTSKTLKYFQKTFTYLLFL